MRVGRHRRRVVATAAVALATLLLRAPADAGESLLINQSSSWPISSIDGSGLFDRVVAEAMSRVGLDVEFQALPSERSLLNASAGIDDGDGPRIDGLDEHYPGLVQVPEPVVRFEFVAFSRDADLQIEDWDDLVGREVAIIRGWKILERSIQGAASLVRVRVPTSLAEMLRLDRTEVFVVERWMGLALADQAGIDDLQVHEPPLAVREMYLYLHRRYADVVPVLAEAMRELKRDGTYAALAREVLGGIEHGLASPGTDPARVEP